VIELSAEYITGAGRFVTRGLSCNYSVSFSQGPAQDQINETNQLLMRSNVEGIIPTVTEDRCA
jgi:hypothetical protein